MERKPYATPGATWVSLVKAADLMGCDRTTAYRRLKPHLVKRLHAGRRQNCVLLSRVRHVAIPVAEEQHQTSPDIREMRAQIRALERAQIKLARAIGKVAQTVGVTL